MSDRNSQTGGREMKDRLKALSKEITDMYREFCWMAMQTPDGPTLQTMADIDLDVLANFKSAVDNMRDLLWKYLDSAAKVEPERVQDAVDSQKLLRGTRLQQLLRERLVYSSSAPPKECFVETISTAIQEMLDRDNEGTNRPG